MLTLLNSLAQQKAIRPLDYQFARLLHSLHGDPLLALVSALASYELGKGNVCLPLAELDYNHLFDQNPAVSQSLLEATGLAPDHWHSHLQNLTLISNGQQATPLVYDSSRVYLYRYWDYETRVARYLNRQQHETPDTATTKAILDRLFGRQPELDWQKVAAALAASRSFSVISGGPGTGKTTTVTRLLALLIELGMDQGRPPLIRLVAPTGKAAARLTESVSGALEKLDCTDRVRNTIPTQAGTIHRLLGVIPNSPDFRHNPDNPLHLDILVVDEASMIDLPMMSRLLDALPDHARLILLGDRDQLASVEAGSVLGDICNAADSGYSLTQAQSLEELTGYTLDKAWLSGNNSPAGDHLCMLRKSYRFHEGSGIGQLARAVNANDQTRLQELLASPYQDIALHPVDAERYQSMIKQCVEGYRQYLTLVHSQALDADIIAAFNRFQLLCALREGPFGVSGLNETIHKALRKAKLIDEDSDSLWYPGRPVLITRNDHGSGLYNGDIGITVKGDDGRLRVLFELPGKELKRLLPSRLPEHETVYAMTIHKSQGSEFEHTLMVLPDQPNPVVTRELVYTGITRARQRLELYCNPGILVHSMANPTRRASGLEERLRSSNEVM